MAHVDMMEPDIGRVLSERPLGSMAITEAAGAIVDFLRGNPVRHMTGATFDTNSATILAAFNDQFDPLWAYALTQSLFASGSLLVAKWLPVRTGTIAGRH